MPKIKHTNRIISGSVMAIDILAINLLFYFFQALWFSHKGEQIINEPLSSTLISLSVAYLISIFFTGLVFYRRHIRADQVVRTALKNMLISYMIWLTIQSLISQHEIFLSHAFIYYFCLATIVIVLLRIIHMKIIKSLRIKGHNKCRVVLLGSSNSMCELYGEMIASSTSGYQVAGYFSDEVNPLYPDQCKHLGKNNETMAYLKNNDIDRVYCGLPSSCSESILSVITYCERNKMLFFSVPSLRNYLNRRVNLEMFSNVPLLSIRNEPLMLVKNRTVKRIFDIIFSLTFVCTIFPFIYIIVGTITKLTSRGPVIFKQKRHGLDGKEFWCYKFRSMRVNDQADTIQASENDPRKTRFGDFLRKTSIDELPQFVNVLLGDMSVVGPRPHMIKHTEEYSKIIDNYMLRHLVKPGITGLAQVTGYRGEIKDISDMQGRVNADIWYMEHWTFLFDMLIIFRTVTNIISNKDKTAY